MPLVPYKEKDIQEPKKLVEAIRIRRGGSLLDIDRMLLHSPSFAMGWNSLLGAVRNELGVPDRLRELAICTIAILNKAEYEYIQHAPEFLKAGGTKTQLSSLQSITTSSLNELEFNATEKAIIQLSIEMTQSVQVKESTLQTIDSLLKNNQYMVELIGIIATYNMVTRFLVALGIETES